MDEKFSHVEPLKPTENFSNSAHDRDNYTMANNDMTHMSHHTTANYTIYIYCVMCIRIYISQLTLFVNKMVI